MKDAVHKGLIAEIRQTSRPIHCSPPSWKNCGHPNDSLTTGPLENLLSHGPWGIRILLGLIRVELPALGFLHLADLSLDVLEDLVLERAKLAVPLEHALVAAQEHVEP